MSFILSDIGNALGGVFRPVTNVISGGVNAVASIPNDIQNFGNAITSGFNNFLNFLKGIPGDIFSWFQNIAYSIIGASHLLGSWFHSGMATLGAHLMSAIKIAFSPIMDAVQFIVSHVGDFVSWLAQVIGNLWNAFNNIHQTFMNLIGDAITIINDAVSLTFDFLNLAPTMFSGFSKYVDDILGFLTQGAPSLVSTVTNIYHHFTDSAPFNVLKQESSKFGTATARAIGFNTAMEVIKSTSRRIWLAQNISPFMRALMLTFSPFVAGMVGNFTETVLKSFYPDIQTSTVQHYIPPTTSVSTISRHTTHVSISPITKKSYSTTLLPASLTPPGVPPLQFKPGHIISIYIEDLITLTGFTVTGGLVSASQYAQILAETLDLDYNLLIRVVPLFTVEAEDVLTPSLTANITTAVATGRNTMTVNMYAEAGQLAIPLGARLCAVTTAETGTTNGENTVDNLNVHYNVCLEMNNALIEIPLLYISTAPPPPNIETTEVNLYITTAPPPPNVETTLIDLGITTVVPPPDIPTTVVSLAISTQFSIPSGSTTLYMTTYVNGVYVTTVYGSIEVTGSITYTPGISIDYG